MSLEKREKDISMIRCLFDQQVGKNNVSLYDELFSESVCVYGPASGQVIKGLVAVKRADAGINRIYPEKKFDIQEIFAHENKIIVHWICVGMHKGEFKEIPSKRREFSVAGVSIYQISKGKIDAVWHFWDRLGILEQIGEVHVCPNPVEPSYYTEILKGLGVEVYSQKASLLSKRERECLIFLLQGKTAKETATNLGLSPRTVESYFENIKKKLKCWSKGELFETAQILEKLELL